MHAAPAVFRQIAFQGPEFPEWLSLRQRVLRDPLGLVYSPGDIAAESGQFHLCGFLGERLVAGLIFHQLDSETWKMRQVAVEAERQRGGLGSALVRFGEWFVAERGCRRIVLHARHTVVDFYEKLGYHISAPDSFIEVGIPHFKMEKMM